MDDLGANSPAGILNPDNDSDNMSVKQNVKDFHGSLLEQSDLEQCGSFEDEL